MELANKYCTGRGIEIGGAERNPFYLNSINVDLVDDPMRGKYNLDILCDSKSMPFFKSESQDFIFSSHVFEHIDDPIAALTEWHRILKPGGILFMIVPHKERTFDKDRERTPLSHIIHDFETKEFEEPGYGGHYHVWITEDLVELINYTKLYDILEVEDVDSQVGNGFTIVARKK